MRIPPDASLYYITELQLKRLKLVHSTQVAMENADHTEIAPAFDEEQDATERDRASDTMIENAADQAVENEMIDREYDTVPSDMPNA